MCAQYHICAEAYPDWDPLLCDALEVACMRGEDWGAGDDWEERLRGAVLGMRYLVEDMHLSAAFPGVPDPEVSLSIPEELWPTRSPPASSWWGGVREKITRGAHLVARRWPDTRSAGRRTLTAVDDPLPPLGVEPSKMRRAAVVPSVDKIGSCLALVDEPVVFLESASSAAKCAAMDVENGCYRYSLDVLVRSRRPAEVRVSPSNMFVFCRSAHSSIASGEFSPPSVVATMSEAEFAMRCTTDESRPGDLEPVAFGPGPERVYMQSLLAAPDCLVEPAVSALADIAMTQLERVWVSTKGSISALHYDASHSVLVQVYGRKRMVFFPPQMLGMLGIYPLGHPLHRRARVDLSQDRCDANARLFSEFWDALASEDPGCVPVEVILGPGDACTFPPGWAHYTESLDYSVSHTFRFAARAT